MGAFLLYWLSRVLIGLFFVGLIGSAIVVIITFFEDSQLLLEKDEPATKGADEESLARTTREAF